MRTFFIFILGSFLGVAVGFALLFVVIPQLPLPREHKIFQTLGIKKPIIVGFVPYWLVNKATDDYSKKLTMLSYFGLVIGSDGHIVKRISPQLEPGYFKLQSDEMKKMFEDAKKNHVTLSLLVYNQNEASISALISDPQKHAENLLSDINPIMEQYGFTDLNIDIESFQTASDSARQNFTTFVKTIRQEINPEKKKTLSIDLAPREIIEDYTYEPFKIGQLVDTFILMAYDYNQRSSMITGPVAPLGGNPDVRNFDVNVGVEQALRAIPPEKLVLGIPLYGYQWETLSEKPYRAVIPSSGATASQRRVNEELQNCVHCTKLLDPISLQPYVIKPGTIDGVFQQTFYEDEESLQKKIELTKNNHLSGVALWALGYEHTDMLRPLILYKRESTFAK